MFDYTYHVVVLCMRVYGKVIVYSWVAQYAVDYPVAAPPYMSHTLGSVTNTISDAPSTKSSLPCSLGHTSLATSP